MDAKLNFSTLKALAARVPLLLKVTVLHVLKRSPAAGKQDLQVELTVNLIRSFISFDYPLGKTQRSTLKDPGIKGPMWVSKIKMPKPAESSVLQSLIKAIEHHKEGHETYDVPQLADVEAEWTGHRSGVNAKAPQPDVSEAEKYKSMMAEVKEDVTILYFHGGAYYLMDPCSHRPTTARLAKETGGRCLSVRYRLAPQNPFPAALLDALVAYLYLLSPPEGSLHTPVPANKIVFAGDSAGGGLSLALLQTILTIRHMSPNPTIQFHGKDVPLELPAGVATSSPFGDITLSLPSTSKNLHLDYLIPIHDPNREFKPMPFPDDAFWPTSPPRAELYANADILTHPFVSPLSGPKEIWKDAPPIFITIGEELIEDDGTYLAKKVHEAGGTAVLERFDGMPHCFALIFGDSAAGKRCYRGWADFCLDAVHGRVKRTGQALYIHRDGRGTVTKELGEIGSLSLEEVQRMIDAGRDWRVKGEAALVKAWEQSQNKAKL
ncbi:lipase/esterase [Blastomyces dermatitidis ER-3]|uniref:Lipase/esterase n=2 Tax=Blastomyces TaxID=229219 RepID=A0A179UVN0_BLAGS|nr:lipase/esterase [Blastomyces gilchristii SLH14081]XP_045272052.1 lipase/esterase [Blastomyces dermatitidis ER-3]EEQ83974.1 lipase/esterase [Blastomyces dermatitidis ER-3]EQL36257.1 hypothetical protein BDFG_02224 [Blastomyces dermatitidis ATCC 26199]OAT10442.1 lipase/esterase [Blastomyces gilchristii SLH14081]